MSISEPPTAVTETLDVAEPCPDCGVALAADQRYCLNCGRRRGAHRVDYRRELGLVATAPDAAVGPGRWEPRGPIALAIGAFAIVLALAVGIVLGRGDDAAPQTAVVTVAGGTAPAAAAQTAGDKVTDDWPTGESGWTVQLSSVKKPADAADVSAARQAAADAGAPDVGVLDGDAHAGTPRGRHVVYSGRFDSEKQAERAAKDLEGDFPGALVLHVQPEGTQRASGGGGAGREDAPSATTEGAQEAQELQNLSGEEYEEQSEKLPDEVGTGGAAPEQDDKAPGGGTEATTIG